MQPQGLARMQFSAWYCQSDPYHTHSVRTALDMVFLRMRWLNMMEAWYLYQAVDGPPWVCSWSPYGMILCFQHNCLTVAHKVVQDRHMSVSLMHQ